jgi:hypothetical protein
MQMVKMLKLQRRRFSPSLAAFSTNLIASDMTSAPTLQLFSITPSRSRIVFALSHLLFHNSTFLFKGGADPPYKESFPEPSFPPVQPLDILLEAYCAADAG